MNATSEVLKKSKVTPWQEMDGQVLVLLPQKNTIHELNETASFIWKKIDGTLSMQQIADLMTEEFDVDYSTALEDLRHLVFLMKKEGLLVE